MTYAERFLREYWFAQRCLKRLMSDAAFTTSQEEKSHIAKRIDEERAMLKRIDDVLKSSYLTDREIEYVRLRYFENKSCESVSQLMYCSPATAGRIRESMLKKVTPLIKEQSNG